MMRVELALLRSRVGRRLFLLFVGCALLPIVALALVSYLSVNRTLRAQGIERLRGAAKSAVMGIWDRLTFLDTELQILAAELKRTSAPQFPQLSGLLGEDLADRFRSVVLVDGDRSTALQGSSMIAPALEPEESAHLESGKPLLRVEADDEESVSIFLGRRVEMALSDSAILWAELDPWYLWWGPTLESTLPAMTELHVLDSTRRRVLFSSLQEATSLPAGLYDPDAEGTMGSFSWSFDESDYLASYRVVSFMPGFHYPSMTVILSEPEGLVLLPLADFRRMYPAVFLATLWIVLLLSIGQIRRSMIPLEKLRSGTRSLTAGRLETQVEVTSGDEFAELADSFNSMAESLDRQFTTLRTLNQLQEAILSALDAERIVSTVLASFDKILPCEQVSVTLLKPKCAGMGWRYSSGTPAALAQQATAVELTPAEITLLEANPHHFVLDLGTVYPTYFEPWNGQAIKTVIAFPAALNGELVAVVAAGLDGGSVPDDGNLEQARQLTDQVAIALSNARLIEELDDLSWGTLAALARAIDVRSHWTMGHTERVTNLAQQIGRHLGMPRERLEVLHRGGLLHDIGKIGVPSDVLDRPGPLSTSEMNQVREHVRKGARIIEPIPSLADAIPVVLQHHEWFNGQGYPAGLSGNEICLEARVLAVADCYDALGSARPYRPALNHQEVLTYIREGSGSQFDPRVVEALFDLVAPGEHLGRAGPSPPVDLRQLPT